MLDPKLRAEFCDYSVVEIVIIFCDDSLGDAIPTDKVMLNEPGNHILGNGGKRGCFNPLCEVINGEKDEAMSIGSSRFDLSDHINALHCK